MQSLSLLPLINVIGYGKYCVSVNVACIVFVFIEDSNPNSNPNNPFKNKIVPEIIKKLHSTVANDLKVITKSTKSSQNWNIDMKMPISSCAIRTWYGFTPDARIRFQHPLALSDTIDIAVNEVANAKCDLKAQNLVNVNQIQD